jgi:hypothetical protein
MADAITKIVVPATVGPAELAAGLEAVVIHRLTPANSASRLEAASGIEPL